MVKVAVCYVGFGAVGLPMSLHKKTAGVSPGGYVLRLRQMPLPKD
jgi:3-hydroxyisobutyrate dehydrogenase-like beta-hydroxyacid dehydrogenase